MGYPRSKMSESLLAAVQKAEARQPAKPLRSVVARPEVQTTSGPSITVRALVLPIEPKKVISSLTNAQLLEAYQSEGSVWKAGDKLGVRGQSIQRRLTKIGAMTPMRTWTESEKNEVRAVYASGIVRGDGKLDALAAKIGRTKQFISRLANKEGLSRRSRGFTDAAKQRSSDLATQRWKKQLHPRGAFGMKHTDATKFKVSMASRAAWESRTDQQRTDLTHRQLVTRLARFGTLAPPRHGVTWKQGWREIAGRRIFFRSRWEFNYAVYLQFLVEQGHILRWDHEPKTFWFDGVRRGCVSYLPDFEILGLDSTIEYHEVKGWMDARSKTKLRRMAKYHPTVKVRVIDGKWFKANTKKLSFLPGWEK